MKFEDVENARKAYIEKKKRIMGRAVGIAVGVTVTVLAIITAINFGSFQRIMRAFGSVSSMLALPICMSLVMMVLFSAVIVVLVVAILTRNESAQYKKVYKAYFVEQELNKVFTDIKYNHEAGLDRNILKATGLIHTGDKYSSNDLTMGKYKNVNFVQADVHIQDEHTDSDGDTHYTTVFRGRYMIFEFPKKFECRLVLSPHKAFYLGSNPKTGNKMKHIETESVEFNRAFSIYSDDGMEALYILTPDFMVRAQELAESHNGKVAMYFVYNKMIVGVNDNDDIFEPPNPNAPIDESAELAKVTKEITLITNIVDELKLTRKV